MTAMQWMNKMMWIAIVVVFALVIQYLLDPLHFLIMRLERAEASVRLPIVREKWQSREITTYRFDVRVFLPHLCFWSGNLEIRNGRMTSYEKITDPRYVDAWMSPPRSSPYFLCNPLNFEMNKLFGYTETLAEGVSTISFDDQYGFISEVRFGDPGGNGLLSPKIGDCCSGFQILNFQVLEE